MAVVLLVTTEQATWVVIAVPILTVLAMDIELESADWIWRVINLTKIFISIGKQWATNIFDSRCAVLVASSVLADFSCKEHPFHRGRRDFVNVLLQHDGKRLGFCGRLTRWRRRWG